MVTLPTQSEGQSLVCICWSVSVLFCWVLAWLSSGALLPAVWLRVLSLR